MPDGGKTDRAPHGAADLADHSSSALMARLFDVAFYAHEYVDLGALDAAEALEHFSGAGWIEGRNPNPWFDVVDYLDRYPDVAASGVNPFRHFIGWGLNEGRAPSLALTPSRIARQLNGAGGRWDWVAVARDHVDAAFYCAQLPSPLPEEADPVAHYVFCGWRRGLDPYEGFVDAATPRDESGVMLLPPLIHLLTTRGARKPVARKRSASARVRSSAPPSTGDPIIDRDLFAIALSTALSDDAALKAVSTQLQAEGAQEGSNRCHYAHDRQLLDVFDHFDRAHYLAQNPDVAEAGIDPLIHYMNWGWRENRNPNAWFRTAQYAAENPDVIAAGVHPFWHFVVAGRAEGRAREPRIEARHALLRSLQGPVERTAGYVPPEHARLGLHELEQALRSAALGVHGMVLSISHDCYPMVTGGTQILISDEQRRFNNRVYRYLHLSPLLGALTLRFDDPADVPLRLVIDGMVIGVVSYPEIVAAVREVLAPFSGDRIVVTHCALGHVVDGLLALFDAFRPRSAYYWLHDFSSVCEGFHLLRNDLSFCHGPAPASLACRVCVYGERRPRHLADMRRLFEAANFLVVAPSEVAKEVWRRSSALPARGVITVEHCRLELGPPMPSDGSSDRAGLDGDPVKVAFVGYPSPHKGWPLFQQLIASTRGVRGYRFLHFAAPEALIPSDFVVSVPVTVTAEDREAMSRALAEHGTQIVVMLANWPETFSFVTYEALAAGADVFAIDESGNVAATIKTTGRGMVFADDRSFLDFFTSHRAVIYARTRRRHGVRRGALVHSGATNALASGSNASVRAR